MKLIKFFEEYNDEQFESFFNEVINWKEFYYLQDKLTEYEDLGRYIRMDVCIRVMEDNRYLFVYLTRTSGEKYKNSDFKHCKNYYEKDGLYYRIFINDISDTEVNSVGDDGISDEKSLDLFKASIKDRFSEIKYVDGTSGRHLVIKANVKSKESE